MERQTATKKNTQNLDYIEVYNFCSPKDPTERIENRDLEGDTVFIHMADSEFLSS